MPKGSRVDEILSEIESRGYRANPLDKWCDNHPDQFNLFWEFIEKGYVERELPFARIMERFREECPEFPQRTNQGVKRWVDAKLKRR